MLDGGAGDDTLHVSLNFDTLLAGGGLSVVPTQGYIDGTVGTDTFVVRMELGSFGTRVLQPFLERARQVTSRLQPLVDLLDREIPFVSQLVGGMTFRSVLAARYPSVTAFADAVRAFNQFNPAVVLSGGIDVGTFQVPSLSDIRLPSPSFQVSVPGLSNLLAPLYAHGLRLPIFEQPANIVRVLVGQNVDLLTYDIPTLAANLNETLYAGSIPTPVGPVNGRVLGLLRMAAGGTLGYDTVGLRSTDPLDGVFVRGLFCEFSVGLGVEGSYGVPHLIEVGLGGRIWGDVRLSVETGGDGKVRLPAALAALQATPDLVVSYEVYAFVTDFFQVEERDWINPYEWIRRLVEHESRRTLTLVEPQSFTIDL